MKMYMLAAYDSAVKAYLQPFFCRSVNEGIRSFRDAVQAEGSQFGKHAADFHLALVGLFDDNDGGVECGGVPGKLITALECLPGDDVFLPDRKMHTM